MKRAWTLAFVAVVVLAGSAAAAVPASSETTKVSLSEIFSPTGTACAPPGTAGDLIPPEPIARQLCGSFVCRQPCFEFCRSIGCATVCVDFEACTCDCLCP